jgi:PTS system N-acetylgalactosamine-specific IIC component
MALLGLFFTIVVVIGLIAGDTIGSALTTWLPEWAWTGLATAGGMMRFVGFAVLMKVMLSREYWAFYFAGFALANIIAPNLGGQALALIAILGFAVAYYDYTTNIKMKELGEGGNTDGI